MVAGDRGSTGNQSLLVARRLWTKPLSVAVVAVVTSVVAGSFAGWATLSMSVEVYDLSLTVWAFLVTAAGSLAYFSYLWTKAEIVGTGCYLLATAILAKPVIDFGSPLVSGRDLGAPGGVQSLGAGVVGLLLWSVVAVLLAGLFVAVGNYFRRRAQRTYLYRLRMAVRE
jgi:hypothetical protein